MKPTEFSLDLDAIEARHALVKKQLAMRVSGLTDYEGREAFDAVDALFAEVRKLREALRSAGERFGFLAGVLEYDGNTDVAKVARDYSAQALEAVEPSA